MQRTIAICAVLMLASMTPAMAQDAGVAVQVGGSADYDACMTQARVSVPDHPGTNSIAVRQGPGADHVITDQLAGDDLVQLCDESGAWRGIVYGEGDCGVMSPIPERQSYHGSCNAGWVISDYLEEVAG